MVQLMGYNGGYAAFVGDARISFKYKTLHEAERAVQRMVRTAVIEVLARGADEARIRDALSAYAESMVDEARALRARYGDLDVAADSPVEFVALGNAAALRERWPAVARDRLRDIALCHMHSTDALRAIYG